eukprot:1317476-Amorphochlora_amoeboformis.AAC.1
MVGDDEYESRGKRGGWLGLKRKGIVREKANVVRVVRIVGFVGFLIPSSRGSRIWGRHGFVLNSRN